jgi:hypothetical protein
MRRTWLALIGLTALVAVSMVWLAYWVPAAPVVVLVWTGVWLLAATFAWGNTFDSYLDVRAATRIARSRQTIAGGIWLARNDALQALAATAMAAVGLSVMLQIGTSDTRTLVILAGGVAIMANQILNRLDRERLEAALVSDDAVAPAKPVHLQPGQTVSVTAPSDPPPRAMRTGP